MDDDLRPVSKQELLFDVEQALRKASKFWPRRRVPGDDNELRVVAAKVIEHLERCGIRYFRKPPRAWHSSPPAPLYPAPDTDDDDG